MNSHNGLLASEDNQDQKESGETFEVCQKVEALFDLLRRPAYAPQAEDIAPGKMLGEFAILRPLASGGMGRVYLARQESLGRLVALKVCKPEIASDPRMKSRFLAEALSLAQLTHPNVVPVLTSGEDEGYLYLAMEYVAGPTLAQVLQAVLGGPADALASEVVARVLADPDQDRPLAEGHAKLDRAYQTWIAQTLQQVAQGLAAAHAAGILHRDIKPANVVFATNGVPKIVDFGLARTSQTPSSTIAGEFFGTPAYTSPEQARGNVDEISPASDVFSFGATLFECLSLDRPFPGRTSADVLSAVLNSDAPLLRRVEKGTPWELEAIADKCLRKSPAERYPSAESLAKDLRNYLELRPVSARPISKIGRVGRMIRRRPGVAASLFALAISTAAALLFAGQAWEEFKTAKIQSAKQEQELAKHAEEELAAEKIKTIAKRVDEGDVALFRCLSGQRPTWLPAVIEKHRQDGIHAYAAALDLNPDMVWPLVQRARLHASKKEDLALALADLDRAQQLKPGFGSIRKFRANVLDDLGRKDEALAARQEAKALYPTGGEDLYWLGVIAYSIEQNLVASHEYFSRALLVAPNHYWSRLERAFFGRIPSEDDASTGRTVMTELNIARTIRPDLPFASEFLVNFDNSLEPARKKKELEEQIERFGIDILRAHQMSDLLLKERNYDEAGAILHKILVLDTGGRTAEKIGDLESKKGNHERARNWYRRATSEGLRYPLVYVSLARAYTALKDWKAAEKSYLNGITENPRVLFLYQSLGFWYDARGRVSDAERAYRKGCDFPYNFEVSSRRDILDLAGGYKLLGLFLGKEGRYAESVQVLKRGIARLENLLVRTDAGQPQMARLIEVHIASLTGSLGNVYFQAGKRKDALDLVLAELKKRPLRPGRAHELIAILHLLGEEQLALETGRLAEFTTVYDPISNDKSSRQLATTIVDDQLQRLGLFKELGARLETRRALEVGRAPDKQGESLLRAPLATARQQPALTALVEALKAPEKEVDLGRAALLLTRLDNETLETEVYLKKLDKLASEAVANLPKDADERTKLDALKTFLFKERGFHGSDQFNRSSSHLNKVIDNREGLPITLSVLYIELGHRLKIPLVGLALPGRFMVRYEPAKGAPQVIDVFDGGKFLTDQEVEEMVRRSTGQPLDKRFLAATTKKAIILRMLYNLLSVASQEQDREGVLRYLDGILSIAPDSHKDRWTRAVMRFQIGQRQGARADVAALLRAEPPGLDLNRVRELQKLLETKN